MLAAQKANSILGYIKRSMTIGLREKIISLYSALERLQLQYCIQGQKNTLAVTGCNILGSLKISSVGKIKK